MLKKHFKKLVLALLAIVSMIALTACGSSGGGDNGGEVTPIPANTVRVHYNRTAGDYDNMTLWLFKDTTFKNGAWPNGMKATGKDTFGVYYDVPLNASPSLIGFVPVNSTIGDASKDAGDHIFQFPKKYNEIYVFQGDINCYIDANKHLPLGIVSAEITASKKIVARFIEGTDFPDTLSSYVLKTKAGATVTPDSVLIDKAALTATFNFTSDLDLAAANVPYQVTYDEVTVDAGLGYAYTDSIYAYNGDDLGATYNGGPATLKLWAPYATAVKVTLYTAADQAAVTAATDIALTKDSKGVWSIDLNSTNTGITDLDGYLYQYTVTTSKGTAKALDPYAKSMGEFKVTSAGVGTDLVGKAAIVNPANTAVSGLDYANLPANWKREDSIIWEIHVRDFTSQEGLSLTNQFGTYSAFKEKVNYIKSLGVTHVQLLPVMSYYFGDESKAGNREGWLAKNSNYNWGYDPQSYFAPEGMYATNRTNPDARIKEFKELVKALHDEGIAVTLDVVYNHMAKTDIMDSIYPGYFYRAGKNASGCGNDTASENAMMRKLIIDSLVYWTKEYKVDGFRFDLMGIIDSETVKEAYDAVSAENPKTLFIGEGWKMYSGPVGTSGADQDWMTKTDNVAVFSDEFRNELKSGYGCEGFPRFITNGAREAGVLMKNIKAQPGNFTADDPGDVVQYIEAHDNLTLHDVVLRSIADTQGGGLSLPASETTEEFVQKRIRLGNTIILTSQGIAFMHGGQEYGRSKKWGGSGVPFADKYNKIGASYYCHDSYDSSDLVNQFDWASVLAEGSEQNKTMNYTKGLIAIRKSSDAFRLGTKALVDSNVSLVYPADSKTNTLTIVYKVKGVADTSEYYIIINADRQPVTIPVAGLDAGTVIADDDEAGTTAVTALSGATITSSQIVVKPLTAIIVKK